MVGPTASLKLCTPRIDSTTILRGQRNYVTAQCEKMET